MRHKKNTIISCPSNGYSGTKRWALRDQGMGIDRPRDGHSGTKGWASTDQGMGIDRPRDGHLLPMRCAQSAQKSDDFWALLADQRLCFYA